MLKRHQTFTKRKFVNGIMGNKQPVIIFRKQRGETKLFNIWNHVLPSYFQLEALPIFLAASLLLIAQLDKFHEIEGEPSGVFFWIVFKSKPTNLFFDQTWSVFENWSYRYYTIVGIRWSLRNLFSPLCFLKIITGCLLSMWPFTSFLFVKVSCLYNIFWNNLLKSKVQSKLKKVWDREYVDWNSTFK